MAGWKLFLSRLPSPLLALISSPASIRPDPGGTVARRSASGFYRESASRFWIDLVASSGHLDRVEGRFLCLAPASSPSTSRYGSFLKEVSRSRSRVLTVFLERRCLCEFLASSFLKDLCSCLCFRRPRPVSPYIH